MTGPGDVFVAITQRRQQVPGRGEYGDFLDERFAALPALAGHRLLPVPNDLAAARRLLDGLDLRAVVLTGGNDLPSLPGARDVAPGRDAVEAWLLGRAGAGGVPVVGICHGAQVLAASRGALLVDARGAHAGTRHELTTVGSTPWAWPDRFPVASHHRFALPAAGLPAEFTPLALAPDGTVEALAHREHPWWGLMWHPEREQPPGPGHTALAHLLTHEGA